jgi:decaprenylphospho-beta-D-ribofuranose 2-oxidase
VRGRARGCVPRSAGSAGQSHGVNPDRCSLAEKTLAIPRTLDLVPPAADPGSTGDRRDVPLTELHGWGRQPLVQGRQVLSEDFEAATCDARLSRGLGRSYGDASLPVAHDLVAGSQPANRFLGFDPQTGVLRAEAGLSLEEIYRLFLPRRWFVPVTPGTKFVTLGGMVAADVHGKNHHQAGCLGAHVTGLRMRIADGRIVSCSPTVLPDLFRATLGGMGLTGHILEVDLRMVRIPSPWIWGENERIDGIDAFVDRLSAAATRWPFTAGWIDCLSRGRSLGRGILFCGRWAEPDEAPARPPPAGGGFPVPFCLPRWAISRLTSRVFNAAYFLLPRARRGIVHPNSFFYPLDGLHHWHRLYGKPGLTQYQCVIPHSAGRRALHRLMEIISEQGVASPLCVIKDCGPEGEGLLSFPKPGISIAVDFPVRSWTQAVIDALNDLVVAEGGRIYLAKDAFTRRAHLQKMDPRLPRFQEVRRRWDPDGRLRSALSRRLLDDDGNVDPPVS